MKRRLFLEIEAYYFLDRQRKREREMLLKRMQQIAEFPEKFADYDEFDEEIGRCLDFHVCKGFAIGFWDDFADRHLKVMRQRWADGDR